MSRRDWKNRAEAWFIVLCVAVALVMLLVWLFGVPPVLELLS